MDGNRYALTRIKELIRRLTAIDDDELDAKYEILTIVSKLEEQQKEDEGGNDGRRIQEDYTDDEETRP